MAGIPGTHRDLLDAPVATLAAPFSFRHALSAAGAS